MQINTIKTPIIHPGDSLEEIILSSLPAISERSVIAVTSKIVSLSEHRIAPKDTDKHSLAKQESEYYIDPSHNQYGMLLTIAHNILIPNAGIDESNADGNLVLWPKNPQASANKLWELIRSHYGLSEVGIIMTDSRSSPLRWGISGVALAHCGFQVLYDYRGTQDLFGRELKVSQVNVADSLAAAAVYVMGEGNESTPLAVIQDIPRITFQSHVPTPDELSKIAISLDEDLYGSIMKAGPWQRGGKQ